MGAGRTGGGVKRFELVAMEFVVAVEVAVVVAVVVAVLVIVAEAV